MAPDAARPSQELAELRVLAEVVEGDDLLKALSAIPKLKRAVVVQEKALVMMARHAGHSWVQIADALGLNSRQAAQDKFASKKLERPT